MIRGILQNSYSSLLLIQACLHASSGLALAQQPRTIKSKIVIISSLSFIFNVAWLIMELFRLPCENSERINWVCNENTFKVSVVSHAHLCAGPIVACLGVYVYMMTKLKKLQYTCPGSGREYIQAGHAVMYHMVSLITMWLPVLVLHVYYTSSKMPAKVRFIAIFLSCAYWLVYNINNCLLRQQAWKKIVCFKKHSMTQTDGNQHMHTMARVQNTPMVRRRQTLPKINTEFATNPEGSECALVQPATNCVEYGITNTKQETQTFDLSFPYRGRAWTFASSNTPIRMSYMFHRKANENSQPPAQAIQVTSFCKTSVADTRHILKKTSRSEESRISSTRRRILPQINKQGMMLCASDNSFFLKKAFANMRNTENCNSPLANDLEEVQPFINEAYTDEDFENDLQNPWITEP